jgi:periplasmic divalent cation tolerance protein
MATGAVIVFATFPDAETAERIVRIAVEERLAACANILPQIQSIYRWKGAVESATETLVLFKTTAAEYQQLEERIRELHPYEVPEVIAVPIESGQREYLTWISDSVGRPRPQHAE